MPEWLVNILASIGGGTVVLIGVVTIFKGLLVKMFESGIEASFEKGFEKFKNRLARSTKAYEILLDREMRFYEKSDPIIAELIPLEHDLRYYLERHEESDRKSECEKLRECVTRYCQLVITLKNEVLIHQSYIPQEVFDAFSSVVKQMQDDMHWWHDMTKLAFDDEYSKIDYKQCDEVVDQLLLRLAFAETKVRSRLNILSGED